MGVHILLHTFKHDSSRPPMNTYIAHTLREGHLITINAAKPPSKVLVQIHPIPLETSTCHLLRLQYRSIAFFAGLQYAYNNILSRQAPKARSSTALRVFVSIANSQAQPVLHGLRVVVDGVNNLLVLRDALVALQLHSTLQVRNLACNKRGDSLARVRWSIWQGGGSNLLGVVLRIKSNQVDFCLDRRFGKVQNVRRVNVGLRVVAPFAATTSTPRHTTIRI